MFSVYEMQHKYLNLSLPECSSGYQGPNCSYVCRYPNYGDDCQSFCDCVELQCDHITGCRQLSNVHDYALHLAIIIPDHWMIYLLSYCENNKLHMCDFGRNNQYFSMLV